MTLVLALICSDGILMASDGQSTFSTSAGPMRLPSEKIRALAGRLLWGGSGAVGLLQKIEIVLNDIDRATMSRPVAKVRAEIRGRVLREQKAAQDTYLNLAPQFPLPTAHILLSGYEGERPWILEIDPNGTDTQLEEYGFAAVGSGAHFAYAVLSGYGRHPWTLETGKVVSFKVIHEAINVAAFGLGPPIQMWEIPRSQPPRRVEDINGIRDTYEAWVQLQLEELGQLTAPPGPDSRPPAAGDAS